MELIGLTHKGGSAVALFRPKKTLLKSVVYGYCTVLFCILSSAASDKE